MFIYYMKQHYNIIFEHSLHLLKMQHSTISFFWFTPHASTISCHWEKILSTKALEGCVSTTNLNAVLYSWNILYHVCAASTIEKSYGPSYLDHLSNLCIQPHFSLHSYLSELSIHFFPSLISPDGPLLIILSTWNSIPIKCFMSMLHCIP